MGKPNTGSGPAGRPEMEVSPISRIAAAASLTPLLPLYAVVFAGFVGYSLMITVFTPMIMSNHDLLLRADEPMSRRVILLGVLLCLYPLGQFVGSPVLGALSDRFGRKPVLMVSLCFTTACYAFIGTALYLRSLRLLALASLLAGLSEANVVAAQSAIADVITPENRNRFFGYIYLSASSAYIVGPLVGGKLADPGLVPWFSDATPFWAAMILLAITTAATAIFFRETNPPARRHAVSFFQAFTNLRSVVSDHRLRRLYWLNFAFYLAIFGFFRCYPMYLVDRFHLGVSQVSEFVAWVGVPIVIANVWFTGFLAARFTTRTLTIWSAFLTGAFMIVVVAIHPQRSLWVTLFLTSGALAICLPACATLLSKAASEAEQGRAMGNNQALQVGAEALSGLVGGAAAAVFVELPLILLGILAITAALFLNFGRTSHTDEGSTASVSESITAP
ncbi:MAG TPA: MFS transporter [Acidobacteriaceae bacterium]|nr:MFS transporter [Acidobacteriaceae bacterium]